MTVFIDASALVATATGEPEARDLEEEFGAAERRLSSPIALWETARAVTRKRKVSIDVTYAELTTLLQEFAVDLVTIGEAETVAAIAAQARYGKGTGHPARLNMGDCFAYACATTHGAALLYTGDDFSHTDLA
ncbi:type II toxin-antitoxin system VapC family toxin [Sphingomonas sp. RHCKR7]|uniref:type II toxin-antitoxin system VapC family toxin n=1 Tax=Sphingomonas folli TaxID=2862497 RepID=UPI001C67788A|nr:type II toxin-antitoxin system VapC family toxin [Sphingomonas folli]MBW6527608.1 type II toxin-antitoxin system VapC family toxin [Sphingomonas folli]